MTSLYLLLVSVGVCYFMSPCILRVVCLAVAGCCLGTGAVLRRRVLRFPQLKAASDCHPVSSRWRRPAVARVCVCCVCQCVYGCISCVFFCPSELMRVCVCLSMLVCVLYECKFVCVSYMPLVKCCYLMHVCTLIFVCVYFTSRICLKPYLHV